MAILGSTDRISGTGMGNTCLLLGSGGLSITRTRGKRSALVARAGRGRSKQPQGPGLRSKDISATYPVDKKNAGLPSRNVNKDSFGLPLFPGSQGDLEWELYTFKKIKVLRFAL